MSFNKLQPSELQSLENLKVGNENETAIEAIDRYEHFLNLYNKYGTQYNISIEDTDLFYKPDFFDSTRNEDLIVTEKKYSFSFPPSYREFVLNKGLFKFGKSNDNEGRLFHTTKVSNFNTVGRLSDALESFWGINFTSEGLSPEAIDRLSNIIFFSHGEEDLQREWFFCFDLKSKNPSNGEMSVVTFNQDNWKELTKTKHHIEEGKGFDKHISSYVNRLINDLI